MLMKAILVRPVSSTAQNRRSLFLPTKATIRSRILRCVNKIRNGCRERFAVEAEIQSSWTRDVLWQGATKCDALTTVLDRKQNIVIFRRSIARSSPAEFFVATVLLSAAASLVSSYAVAEQFDISFQHVAVGLTKGAVIAILGDPDAEVSSTTLGFQHSWARWTRAGRTYKVQFVDKYVIGTTICTASVTSC
jgi:hypothetical protein